MRRLYGWLLSRFLLVLGFFALLQAILIGAGLIHSLRSYDEQRREQFEALARTLLVTPAAIEENSLGYSDSFFVFRADGSLVFSNRGQGRSIPAEEWFPVEYEGAVIGYWYSGETGFFSRRENTVFLTALVTLLGGSMLLFLACVAWFAQRISGQLSGYMSRLRDDVRSISNRRQVEVGTYPVAELADISRDIGHVSSVLAEEDEYKARWMQDLAHDLRTPVAAIRGQLEGMRDGVFSTDAPRLERNLAELQKIEMMIEGMNDLLRMEAIDVIAPERLSVEELFSSVIASFEHLNDGNRLQTAAAPGLYISADRELIHRALTNLLGNALKYGDEDKPIVISASTISESFEGSDADRVIIRICNSLKRELETDVEVLFNRFYRGDSSRGSKGSGLGLNIARRIASIHGGVLKGYSEDHTICFELILKS